MRDKSNFAEESVETIKEQSDSSAASQLLDTL